jgi:hypothetical protein
MFRQLPSLIPRVISFECLVLDCVSYLCIALFNGLREQIARGALVLQQHLHLPQQAYT